MANQRTLDLVKLSGSTDGRPIKVAATVLGSATTIHTVAAGTDAVERVWLYASNQDTVARDLTIAWGGTTSPDDESTIELQPKAGRVLVVGGDLLRNGLVVKAYASAANVVMLSGYAFQYTVVA